MSSARREGGRREGRTCVARLELRGARQARRKGPYGVSLHSEEQARAKAKDSERRDPLFEAAVDEHWPQQFARHAATTLALDRAMVKALLRVHEAEEVSTARLAGLLSPKLWVGVALTAFAFFLNQVPKELFTYLRSKGWLGSKGWLDVTYTEYRAFAFFALLVAFIYMAVILLSVGSMMGRSNPTQVLAALRGAKSVLVYLDASYEVLDPEPQKTPEETA